MVEEVKKVELIDVPTQFQKVFKLPDGTLLNADEYLAWMGTIIYNLQKVWGK